MNRGVNWQKIRIPIMERLALADMAARHGKSEEDMLAEVIREAVKHDLVRCSRADRESPEVRDGEE